MTKNKKEITIQECKKGFLLCKENNHKSGDVYLSNSDRLYHEYFVGHDDAGKSTLILNQAIYDLKEGNGFCFIDQYGDYVDELLKYFPKERIDDLIYFDLSNTDYPIGLNPLDVSVDSVEEKDIVVNGLLEMFIQIYGPEIFGPRIQDYFRNACLLLMDQPEGGTMVDIMRLFTDDAFAERMIRHIKDPIVRSWWNRIYMKMGEREKEEILPFIQAKFGPFTTGIYVRNIIGQPKSAFNMYDAMQRNSVILVNLSKGIVGNFNSSVIGSLIISQIKLALRERSRNEYVELRPYYLYLDGFHDYVGSSCGDFFKNATRSKVGITMFNQYVSQFNNKNISGQSDILNDIFNLVGTILIFRNGCLDDTIFDKIFNSNHMRDNLKNLKRNDLIIKKYDSEEYIEPFAGYVEGFNEKIENIPDKVKIIKEISVLKWGTKRDIIDKEIYFRMDV